MKNTRWAFTTGRYQSPPFKPGFMKPSDLGPKDAQNAPDTQSVDEKIISKGKTWQFNSATELIVREKIARK